MVEQTGEHNCNLVFNRKKIVKLTILLIITRTKA